MTLHYLEVLAAVCQEKTMHAAAEKLHISQPAISKIISDLEKHYNVKMFERINHRLFLTPVGAIMRDRALEILELFARMEDEINIQGQQSHIRIGASVSVGTRLLPPLLARLSQQEKTVTYEVVVNNTSRIEQLVSDYMLDLALVEGSVDNPNLIAQDIVQDELVLAVRAGHPLAGKPEVRYEDLEQYPFVTREDGSSNRNQLERSLQEKGAMLKMNYSCSSVEAIKQALLYTDGIAALSGMMVEEEIKEGVITILPLDGMRFMRSIRLIYHKNKYMTPGMKAFIGLLDDEVQNSSDSAAP